MTTEDLTCPLCGEDLSHVVDLVLPNWATKLKKPIMIECTLCGEELELDVIDEDDATTITWSTN